MKSKPILFSTPMMRALLEGRKTQTREVIKPQPADDINPAKFPNTTAQGWESSLRHKYGSKTAHFCPYGKVGDLLWVQETFAAIVANGVLTAFYKADDGSDMDIGCSPFKPSIHMPRWASRLTLEITDVRVERLQDITPDDAGKEGIFTPEIGYFNLGERAPVIQYAKLFEEINGTGSWETNPYVWVLEFKVHHKNVDELIKELGVNV